MTTAIQTLSANVAFLSSRDQTFANDLLRQANQRGLSDRQMYWVGVLNDRATKVQANEPKDAVEVGEMSGLVALLATARQHLKRPKIRLQTEDGSKVVISIAGPKSKAPGSIQVTNGGQFDASVFYGRVTPEGTFKATAYAQRILPSLTALLTALSTNPVKVAADYGKLLGKCCFCGKSLEDPRSTDVGFGPICAAHYNLPWG